MADFTGYVNAIRTRLEGNFAALPLRWPNDDRSISTDATAAPNGFVYSEVRVTDEEPASLGPDGSRVHRDYGEFAVYIYVPLGTKAGTAEAYAEQIRALFKMSSVSGVVFRRRTIGTGQNIEGSGGRMWCVPLILEFYADRTE